MFYSTPCNEHFVKVVNFKEVQTRLIYSLVLLTLMLQEEAAVEVAVLPQVRITGHG